MGHESCDRCGDIDADNYYDCDNCHRHLCEPCFGDITLTVCKSCEKDPVEGKVIARQRQQIPSVSFPIDIKHPQVVAFAKAMDDILTKNDYKGGWGDCSKQYLRARLVEEMGEYFGRVANFIDGIPSGHSDAHDVELAKKELLDIANYSMMLWDRS